eukprot:c15092_g1_i1 orf=215-376(+)
MTKYTMVKKLNTHCYTGSLKIYTLLILICVMSLMEVPCYAANLKLQDKDGQAV